MSRLLPFRAKPSAAVQQRIDDTLATTMYLVQTTGPTSYMVQEANCERKHKVLVGALQNCSCGEAEVCIHLLFVMLKIDALLRGDYREKTRTTPPPRTAAGFLKKNKKDANANANAEPQADGTNDANAHEAQRHTLVEGEVCAICQEDMAPDQPLTFCRQGCGNNFHVECMKVFGESRKQSKEHLICPLCRCDWGECALVELTKQLASANKAPNVHKRVGCKKCHASPIRNERYRCVQCKHVDLCGRCFKMNSHPNHQFVVKTLVTDAWAPAVRSNQQQRSGSAHTAATELLDELQSRELTTNDYDLLLQLDQRDTFPIQDYLLSTLSGQRVAAAEAKSFGEPGGTCSVCRQSLRIQADVRQVLCGHAFHESCLARSILAHVYVCPSPGCDRVLFPGLYHLTVKPTPATAAEAEPSGRPHTTTLLQLGAAFSVLPLQQQALPVLAPSSASGRREKCTKQPAQRKAPTTPAASRPEADLACLSIGLAPAMNSLIALPPLAAKPSRSSRSHGQRSDATARGDSRSQESRLSSDLVPMGGGAISSQDRLQHANDLRSELQHLDKDRLRKLRLQREERVRQNLSNNESNHAALNALLPPIGRCQATPPLIEPPGSRRAPRKAPSVPALDSKRKAAADVDARKADSLADLVIGAVRRP